MSLWHWYDRRYAFALFATDPRVVRFVGERVARTAGISSRITQEDYEKAWGEGEEPTSGDLYNWRLEAIGRSFAVARVLENGI